MGAQTRQIKKKQAPKRWRERIVAAIFGHHRAQRDAAARRAVARALASVPGVDHAD
jgi:hypothetical protein